MSKRTFISKIVMLFVVFLLMVGLGDVRRQYVLNFTKAEKPFFMERQKTLAADFTSDVNVTSHFLKNPKWISSFLYIIAFLILSLLAIISYFHNNNYTIIVLLFYFGILLIAFLVIIAGNFFGFSKEAYSAMENFKELLSSPFIAMLLFSAFLLNEKINL